MSLTPRRGSSGCCGSSRSNARKEPPGSLGPQGPRGLGRRGRAPIDHPPSRANLQGTPFAGLLRVEPTD
jgi:hypothetical protein